MPTQQTVVTQRKVNIYTKKECKACHSQGGEGGELTPMTKTMSQWDRFFDKDKHKLKPEVFNGFTEQDLKDIQQFFV